MDVAGFRTVLEASWRELDEALDGLDERAMGEAGVVEEWSVKDLLGHVTAWEQRALLLVERVRAGEPLPAGSSGPDPFNAAEAERRAALSLAVVQQEHAETRERLRVVLTTLGDHEWRVAVGDERDELGDWLGGTLGGPLGPGTHAAEHAHHILVWRVRRMGR